MKIGFDISQTGANKAGCGYFADALIKALITKDKDNKYILYPYFGSNFRDPTVPKNSQVVNRQNVRSNLIGKSLNESIAFWNHLPPEAEKQLGFPDVVHANNFFCPTKLQNARLVYTLYDLSFIEYPDFTTEENRCVCFEGVFNASNYADFIVSISKYSRKKFMEIFPHYPSERIGVVYPAIRFLIEDNKVEPGESKLGLISENFWLAVGTLEPRKNLRGLLKAYAIYRKHSKSPLQLALAGGKGWLEEDFENFIGELGLEDHISMLGYVTDSSLAWLYSNCRGFIFPSIYEGFGLPVLEAMTFGAAVICSNTTSLPEVAGNAAHYIDPNRELDIVEALLRIEKNQDYQKDLKKKSSLRALKFSWKNSADRIMDIYRNVINISKYE